VVDSIPDWHQRLVGVQILKRNAFDILPRIEDAEGTAIYIDPPYISKGAPYVHDFQHLDHICLTQELHRIQMARVVIRYYEHPLLKKLYPRWTKIDCSHVSKSMVNSGMRGREGRTVAPEVLLVNGDAYNQEATLFD